MKKLYWACVVAIKRLLKHDLLVTELCNQQGYRRAVGGRWGLWLLRSLDHRGDYYWLQSECPHYPTPHCALCPRPIRVEEYV